MQVDDEPIPSSLNALGEVWYTPADRNDSIAILEEELQRVHDAVTAELNLTKRPRTVSSVSPVTMYQYTRRVCELHRKWIDDLKQVQG